MFINYNNLLFIYMNILFIMVHLFYLLILMHDMYNHLNNQMMFFNIIINIVMINHIIFHYVSLIDFNKQLLHQMPNMIHNILDLLQKKLYLNYDS